MELHDKEVRFDIWCESCKYFNLPESNPPCCDCLNEPSNTDSRKPVQWQSKDA